MNRLLFFFLIYLSTPNLWGQELHTARQGQVSFFSYTKVENIQATNNQVYSNMDTDSHEIAVRILMRAFTFPKALMQEHFNESYIESDLYPEATFEGKILDFDPKAAAPQTRMIEGTFTLRDISQPLTIKATIAPGTGDNTYLIEGDLQVTVDDYNIKVPKLLKPNIAKTIKVTFNFEYKRDEN